MNLNPRKFLLHRSPMLFIDSIVAINEKSVCCQAIIKENNIFYDSAICGVHAWVGVEFMAQTMAAFANYQKPQAEPQIGFLMSVRKFSCLQSYFKLNEVLTIIADNEYLQDNVGVFQCRIMINNKLVASAKLSAFQPSSIKNI